MFDQFEDLFYAIYQKTTNDLFFHETAIQFLRRHDKLSECFQHRNEIIDDDYSNQKQYASKT